MTIQGAIAELQSLLNADDVPLYYKGGIRKAIETIQMDAQPKQEWIPCDERLPEDSDDVLITYYCGKEMHDAEIVKMVEESPFFNENVFKIPHIAIAFYIEGDGGAYVWASGEGEEIPDGVHVTAWMPLPEPYKEE